APPAAAQVVEQQLREAVVGADALAPQATARALGAALRNAGRPGLGFEALSAVDLALWDLKARALGLPLCDLAGRVHDEVPVYGSGGFCSYPPGRVAEQLGGWVAGGIRRVKMKVGRRPDEDPQRIEAARAAVG